MHENTTIKKELKQMVEDSLHKTIAECGTEELFPILVNLVRKISQSGSKHTSERKLYYISAEFLIGRLLTNNLINAGIYDDIKELLEENGKSIEELEELEPEPSLGNGGLGRLAACFLDSIATLGLNGDGIGLNYHLGLFKQGFRDNKQFELKNPWITDNSWLTKTAVQFTIPFKSFSLTSTLYDIDIIGYGYNGQNASKARINKLHLFDLDTLDENLVKEGICFDKTDIAHNLTLFLYPDDSDKAGRLLRIYQQYFMVSNAAQYILMEAEENGYPLQELYEHAVIQINDTHPSMVIPELIRLLTQKGISMDEAIAIVSKTCAYTNHTILSEALEKWPVSYLEEVVPHLLPIIRELDVRLKKRGIPKEMAIIDENALVHMAHMDIHYGFSVNGVAALHTEILKSSELKAFNELYPEKFNNKTNGITFRRWLMHCNPVLASYITRLIGPGWKTDADDLKKLRSFSDDTEVLNELAKIKLDNKRSLVKYIQDTQQITIDPASIFDIQIKRLHEYKRQQMNALYIIYKYREIKKGNLPATPVTMLFGAKAAPAYTIAKDIIHLILCLQQLINNDPAVSPYLKIVMIDNYNVTKASKLIPACDVSEQISLSSKEASGTGNMKFMLNGAVTLGTMDGANVEIHDLVGDENIYIFGKSSKEVIDLYDKASYHPADLYDNDPQIEELVDFIISKQLIRIGDPENLCRLYKELIQKDWFMSLLDLKEYISRKEQVFKDYENKAAWNKKMLINTAEAGYFSSDRTILQYNNDIWHL